MLRIELDNGKTVWTDTDVVEFAHELNRVPSSDRSRFGEVFYWTREGYVIAISHIVWVKEE